MSSRWDEALQRMLPDIWWKRDTWGREGRNIWRREPSTSAGAVHPAYRGSRSWKRRPSPWRSRQPSWWMSGTQSWAGNQSKGRRRLCHATWGRNRGTIAVSGPWLSQLLCLSWSVSLMFRSVSINVQCPKMPKGTCPKLHLWYYLYLLSRVDGPISQLWVIIRFFLII